MQDKSTDDKYDMELSDPVCGMTVTENSEQHLHHNGEDFYFCSSGCLDKFHDDPDKYLNPIKDESSESHDAEHISGTYTCPMHPEIEQVGPGSCPKCGMALELKGVPV